MSRSPAHPESPAELIARITAERGAESTGRHGAVAVLAPTGRHGLPDDLADSADRVPQQRAGRRRRDDPAVPEPAVPDPAPGPTGPGRDVPGPTFAGPSPTGPSPTDPSTTDPTESDPAVLDATPSTAAHAAPPAAASTPVATRASRRRAASSRGSGSARHASRRDGSSERSGRDAATDDGTLVTQDADAPRGRLRRLAPLAVAAVVVVLATAVAVTVRPEPDPAEPELSSALVDAQDPSVVQVAPDDVTGSTVPPPLVDEAAPETVGPETPGDGAPVVDGVTWTPAGGDEFTTGLSPAWTVYDTGGRSPDAVSVEDGVLVIRGDATGRTGGIAWTEGSRFGRWEMRARFPQGDPRYNPALLLWPTDVAWPAGGEIDLAETRGATDRVSFFLHHGPDNAQLFAEHVLDPAEWHDYAVEWTADRVTGYVDGRKWFESTDPATLPPGNMQAAVQLDWFPGADTTPAVPTEMQVDHVRIYR